MSIHHSEMITPWQVSLRAARMNLVPGLILQVVSLALMLAYYFWPAFTQWVQPVATWQREYGIWASFGTRACSSGLLPGLFMLLMPALRVKRPLLSICFNMVFWGSMSITAEYLYHYQTLWFGAGHDVGTLVKKTVVDQLVYTVFFAVPVTTFFHFWETHGFSFATAIAEFPRDWIKRLILPVLLPNWIVWTPAMMITYALPEVLQVQFSALIGCFWALFCMQASVHALDHKGKSA